MSGRKHPSVRLMQQTFPSASTSSSSKAGKASSRCVYVREMAA